MLHLYRVLDYLDPKLKQRVHDGVPLPTFMPWHPIVIHIRRIRMEISE